MRICVSGIHGIGKTTLVNKIAEEYKLKVLPEEARILLNKKYSFVDINSNLSVFMDFQNEILDRQVEALEKNKNEHVIMDRSVVDSLAYVVERLSSERHNSSYFLEVYLNNIGMCMRDFPIDHIFYIPFRMDKYIHSLNGLDAFRNNSFSYLYGLDSILFSEYSRILRYTQSLYVKQNFYFVSGHELEEREKEVYSVLDEVF